ncbi:sucrase-isomaltase, intestinal-like [Physella acuta]|uniref:sucrase-isomaltase, intestinal-like n=1 Tax=Physella acuta TaxID=109671 RepID=UPI0027DC7C0B|nr:sucrase-isomaltase, intestinal-like [Physella acuta]
MSGVYALTPKKSKVPRKKLIVGISVSVAIGVAVALTVGLVLHFKLKDDGDTPAQVLRVDCYPELRRDAGKMSTNSRACQERGCVWQKQDEPGAPWCYFPAGHGYHVISGPDLKDNVYRLELRRTPSPPLYNTTVYEEVGVEVDMQTDNRLRVKIFPTNVSRWEIPQIALDIEGSRLATSTKTAQYDVTFSENPFGVVVTRKSSGAVVFNSSQPGLVLSDQFLQLTTRLTNENVYGFGEHRHESFKHDMRWRLWSMFTRDSGPNSDWNLYGQHPVYMNVEDDKKANMVLLKNSNAIEVLLQPHPDPAITYRTIGGVLDFYIFLGDSPADVVKHYLKAIGLPVFPPYWSLGYHLCRWGYANISDMQMVINRTMEAKIPYDGQWADVDTFHKSYVFTYDTKKWANFPALVRQLRKDNMHFVTIVVSLWESQHALCDHCGPRYRIEPDRDR